MTFCAMIRRRKASNAVVVTSKSVWSVDRLLNSFSYLSAALYDKDVAVFVSDVGVALSVLAALDGRAASILIIPASMPRPQVVQIVENLPDIVILSDVDITVASHKVLTLEDGTSDQVHPANRTLEVRNTSWKLLTSGTTGTPKIAIHTLSSIAQSVKQPTDLSTEFVWGLTYEWSRFAGFQVVLQAIVGDSLLVVPNHDWSIGESIKYFAQCNCTHLSATPSYWRQALMTGTLAEMPLRQATLGGEIADAAVLTKIRNVLPKVRISHVYASTEIGVGFAVNDGRAGFPASFLNDPINNWHLSVVNDRLLVRHVKGMNSNSGSSEWIDTGDCVSVEADRIYFRGRGNGLINVGGNKVLPEEVEQVVLELPYVLFVKVSGISSSIIGTLVKAEVVIENESFGGDNIAKCIKDHVARRLDRYKVPAMIELVDKVPIGTSGKLSRS